MVIVEIININVCMYVSSEVSSNFLPETMPALFTKMVTTPTWASLVVMMTKKV